MTDDLVKRLRKRQEFESIDGYKRVEWEDEDALGAADRIEELENALDQLLDDMGEDGLCVCQAAKDQAIEALGKNE